MRLPLTLTNAWRTGLVLSFVLLALPPSVTRAQNATETDDQQKEEPVVAAHVAVKLALGQLREEAEQFREIGELENLEPDFVERFDYTLHPDDLLRLVTHVQDRSDQVIDGYIRFQLLSLEPDFTQLNDRQFERFVESLPGFPKHPTASARLHAECEHMAERAGRNEPVREELQEKWEALQIQMKQHEMLTFPAIEFRDAVADLLPDTGVRRPIFLLYDIRDRVSAGMDTRSIKTRITKEFKARRIDNTLSADERWRLMKEIEKMAKDDAGETRIIRDITFFYTSPATVHYSTRTIRPSDAEKWTAYLNRAEDN